MANTMQFELVSPERSLASVQASEVQIPGAEGDMTVMPDHAPTITTLRPGLLSFVSDQGRQEFLVTGGFAEITATSTSVLAEQALPRDEVTQEVMDDLVAQAVEARERATPQAMDAAVKLVADMIAAGEALGLSVRQ
jgi:F-type H+-transporting ATPase subunit epsilon